MPQHYKLPPADNSLKFFQALKTATEAHWQSVEPDGEIYGFQTQTGTRWRPGLSAQELQAFEKEMGFTFPVGLRNYYSVMNGVDRPAINLYGGSGSTAYADQFYSYPENLENIRDRIRWILEANRLSPEDLREQGISRIFPVYAHRFVLVDHPAEPVLSMYGDDIIFYADNLSQLLAREILGQSPSATPSPSGHRPDEDIHFWLD